MKVKKAIVILLVLVFGISVFTACGGDTPEPESEAPAETVAPEPEPEPEATPDEPEDIDEPEDTDEPTDFTQVTGLVDVGWIQFTLQDGWFIEELRIFSMDGGGWSISEDWFEEGDEVYFSIKREGQGGSISFQTPFAYNSKTLLESAENIVEVWELDPPEDITINGVKYLVVNNDDTIYWLLTSTGGFDLESMDYFDISINFMTLEQALPFLETISVP